MRVGERRGDPEVPELRDHQGQRISAARYPRPSGAQHPRQQGAGDHEHRLDRKAGRDRQGGVALEPLPRLAGAPRRAPERGERLGSSVADTGLTLRGESAVVRGTGSLADRFQRLPSRVSAGSRYRAFRA